MRKMLTLMVTAAVAMPVAIAGAAKPATAPGGANPHKGGQPKVCRAAEEGRDVHRARRSGAGCDRDRAAR